MVPNDTNTPAAAGPGYTREWALFCDYTAATGQPTLPTTVAALHGFLTQVPARPSTLTRRVAAIAAAHRNTGHLFERPTPPTPPGSPPPGPQVGELLAGCATRGWPDGLRGRRDAYLIVLTTALGYPHTHARRIQAADLTVDLAADGEWAWRIEDRAVPVAPDPRRCATCAVVRWLEILGSAEGLGRGSARMHLSAADAPTPHGPHQHDPLAPPRWQLAAQLLPAIDRYGWIEDYQPLSTRSIRIRLARAATRANELTATGEPPTTEPPGPPAGHHPPPTPTDLAEVLRQLDQVADDADALNARIEALLRL